MGYTNGAYSCISYNCTSPDCISCPFHPNLCRACRTGSTLIASNYSCTASVTPTPSGTPNNTTPGSNTANNSTNNTSNNSSSNLIPNNPTNFTDAFQPQIDLDYLIYLDQLDFINFLIELFNSLLSFLTQLMQETIKYPIARKVFSSLFYYFGNF